jgi:hypothetical protein
LELVRGTEPAISPLPARSGEVKTVELLDRLHFWIIKASLGSHLPIFPSYRVSRYESTGSFNVNLLEFNVEPC